MPATLPRPPASRLADWDPLADRLDGYRLVAVDPRGHGLSGDGDFDWASACADLAAVTDALDLGTPAVVGMSLGGLVAVEWADRHPDCPAVVNLDGHPTVGAPDQCPGLDPGRAGELIASLHGAFTAMVAALAAPLPASAVTALLDARRAQAEASGIDVATMLAAARRALTVRDGQTWARPGGPMLAQLRTALADADPYPVYARLTVPTLVARASRDLPEQRPYGELTAAYRRHVADRLARVHADNPRVSSVELDASHAMLWERPAQVAGLISDFLARHHSARVA